MKTEAGRTQQVRGQEDAGQSRNWSKAEQGSGIAGVGAEKKKMNKTNNICYLLRQSIFKLMLGFPSIAGRQK
jgi:hypothetical protein